MSEKKPLFQTIIDQFTQAFLMRFIDQTDIAIKKRQRKADDAKKVNLVNKEIEIINAVTTSEDSSLPGSFGSKEDTSTQGL